MVAVACDMPFVPGALLARLAAGPEAAVRLGDRLEPFPARYEPAALPALRAALDRGAPVRETLAALAPAVLDGAAFGDPGADPGERQHAGRARRRRARAGGAVTDVAVIGGGIAGCATAALLAEAGAAVPLYERETIAAGASGRNSGVLQHPMDAVLEPLHEASLRAVRRARPRLRASRPSRPACSSSPTTARR